MRTTCGKLWKSRDQDCGKGTDMNQSMENPWKAIDLTDYENHMKLDDVRQLQTLNEMMKDQLNDYLVKTVMILGVAGGNGLDHIKPKQFERVYGVDVNGDYLAECCRRYEDLNSFFPIEADLTGDDLELPCAELLLADLLIEYVGCECFLRVVKLVDPQYASCIIQVNSGEETFVSDSPYLHSFDRLYEVHHQVTEPLLTESMEKGGYAFLAKEERNLPNGKKLVRLDYGKEG